MCKFNAAFLQNVSASIARGPRHSVKEPAPLLVQKALSVLGVILSFLTENEV